MDTDYYGKRIVTCSSDQRLKIFDLNDEGEWICTEGWKAHDGAISKVCLTFLNAYIHVSD